MNLSITPTRLIADIQKEFNIEFPYLKLEFFQNKSGRSGLPLKKFNIDNRKVCEVQLSISNGILELKKEMKVQELEKTLKNEFGLTAQVYRRSGNLWLETTMTYNWTLRQQNEHGKELSTHEIK